MTFGVGLTNVQLTLIAMMMSAPLQCGVLMLEKFLCSGVAYPIEGGPRMVQWI